MDDLRGLAHLAGNQQMERTQASVQTFLQGLALVCGRFAQHPVGNFRLHTRVANPQSQAPITIRSELGMQVTQTIVASMPAAMFEFGFPRR